MGYSILYTACVLVTLQLTLCTGNKVLIVSMDGFRWDYIKQVDTPNFDAFERLGTRAQFINNTFITKTFPCHYTIATGLYEESHGIISNHMYDPEYDETFNMGTKDTKWWDGGEPMWVTARKANLRSATFFWPGSEAVIRGHRPNIYKAYDESITYETRVDTVIQWLSSPSHNIDFAMLYFDEPDHTGHASGPDSEEVRSKVKEMDTLLGYIVSALDNAGLWSTVNVIITSDHGMTEIDVTTKHIDVLDYVNPSAMLQIPGLGPTANILVAPGMLDEVVQNFSGVDHLQVFRREDVPEYWHYSNNRRILDIVLVADEGWSIVKNITRAYKGQRGTHGYDNRLQSMKPIFYARGPNIKQGFDAYPFNSVDIYPLVCELLGISPAPNNGTLANTKDFIVYSSPSSACILSYGSLMFTVCLAMARFIS